jgi:UDP-N-acetylglucosamine acyltransferase
MATIDPSSTVSAEAELAPDVQIGPRCVITGRVRLEAGVRLIGSNYLNGPVTIGAGTVVYPFACIGFEPQDRKFAPSAGGGSGEGGSGEGGAATAGVVIGRDGLLREHVTVHAATNDHTPTTIGDSVFMMVGTHVGHDAALGDRVTMVNGCGIAGHCVIEDDVTFGGNAVVHQFCRIGRLVMFSGDCAVSLDVPPFCTVAERNRIGGINLVGLRRAGFDRADITSLRRAYRELLHEPMPRRALVEEMERRGRECPPLAEMARFIAASKRGITPGMGRGTRGAERRGEDEIPE